MKKIFIFIIVSLFLINLVNATTINIAPSSLAETLKQGESKSIDIVYIIQNTDNSSINVNINTGSFPSSLITSSVATIPVPALSTSSGSFKLNISIPSTLNPQTYSGPIYIGSYQLNANVVVESSSQTPSGCNIDIFPLTLSNVKLIQGESKQRTISLSVPLCYPSYVRVNGVILSNDEKPIQIGELNLGNVQAGGSLNIPIIMDAISNVAGGNYQDILQFLIYDKDGNKINVQSVSISVLVTQGINPLDSISLADLPVCSLNSINLNLNNSYKMTCSLVNSNIEIRTITDYNYIQGISVTDTTGQYIYEYKTKREGLTTIGAEFLYHGGNIGSPFLQEVKISSSGNPPISGTSLNFVWYQNNVQRQLSELINGETKIQVIDDKTKNILTSDKYLLYLNGDIINDTFTLESGKPYDLRAHSVTGDYIDKVINFTLSPQNITINAPESVTSGATFTITTVPENASILIDEYLMSYPYSISSVGMHLIRASKEGYLTSTKNITVTEASLVTSVTPPENTKLGKEITVDFSQSVSWYVRYVKNITSGEDSDNFAEGIGTQASFKPKKAGTYNVYTNNNLAHSFIFESSGNWFTNNWIWILIGVLIVGVICYFIFFSSRSPSGESGAGFTLSQGGD